MCGVGKNPTYIGDRYKREEKKIQVHVDERYRYDTISTITLKRFILVLISVSMASCIVILLIKRLSFNHRAVFITELGQVVREKDRVGKNVC